MKEKMSIGEFAKLKNINQETLRHYDRIGLLKPKWVDQSTGYRYYSIFQYEKLSTILELRQLGMPLLEIKEFLKTRDVEKTIELLENQYKKLEEERKSLDRLEKSIAHKLSHLKKYRDIRQSEQYEIKCLPEREILLWDRELARNVPSYGFAELERQLEEFAPIFAENRYGIRITGGDVFREFLFLFCREDAPYETEELRKETRGGQRGFQRPEDLPGLLQSDENTKQRQTIKRQTIQAGTYASRFFCGSSKEMGPFLREFQKKLEEDNFLAAGDIIAVAQIDLSVVGEEGNILYEIQIPVKPACAAGGTPLQDGSGEGETERTMCVRPAEISYHPGTP